jgi:hypothetical protein
MEPEIIDGEVVDDDKLVPLPKRTRTLHIPIVKRTFVDPIWCDVCNHATWQEYKNGAYVCDHEPTSKAPFERKKK